MKNRRKKIPELEKMVQTGRKKFVRYEEGAMLYSMGLHSFQNLAKDAGAVYHVKRIVLVNLDMKDCLVMMIMLERVTVSFIKSKCLKIML